LERWSFNLSKDESGRVREKERIALTRNITNKGLTVWLTGLSGAGKSTIARGVHAESVARGLRADILDGYALRKHISRDLGLVEKTGMKMFAASALFGSSDPEWRNCSRRGYLALSRNTR
jgi:adenylylsulfate kinase-like enzyme